MRRDLPAAACALATALALAAPSGAHAFERIEATFFAEYGAEEYTIDQGEIVTFANTDAFLAHGLVSDTGTGALFSSPVIGTGRTRLLRGTPFLTAAGSPYAFHCPTHPGMTSVLNVGPGGELLPTDDAPPAAGLKIKTGSAAKLVRKRKLRLVLTPSEAVDVIVGASVKGAALGSAERTYVTPGRRVVTLKLSRAAASAVSRLRAGAARVKVKLTLADVAGNVTVVKAGRRL